VLAGESALQPGKNDSTWLGHGIYSAVESSPKIRGMDWEREQ